MTSLCLYVAIGQSIQPAYIDELEKWRLARKESLLKSEGWLSVAGLFWLTEGDNGVGSDSNSVVRLREGFPPALLCSV